MIVFAAFLVLALVAYVLGTRRALQGAHGAAAAQQERSARWHSLPSYHGLYMIGLAVAPALVLWILWQIFGAVIADQLTRGALPPEVTEQGAARTDFFMGSVAVLAGGERQPFATVTDTMREMAEIYAGYMRFGSIITYVLIAVLIIVGFALGLRQINPRLRARNHVEGWVRGLLITAATISILTTIGIVYAVLFESIRFFSREPLSNFLFGTTWSVQSGGTFGAIPLFAGTLLITFIAMCVAAPIGLLSAIYLSEYASPRFRSFAKPMLEILAGIPTVVYGFFAALVVAPYIRDFGNWLEGVVNVVLGPLGLSIALNASAESALAAGGVMGIMIIPFVSSLSDDALSAVPGSLRDASFGMGATTSETIRQVIFPAALPGIIAGLLLAVSRAIGETMIVVMAAGQAANLTANPFEAVTTVTVQIVMLLQGDQEFDSSLTLSTFALGLVLFTATLCLNVFALYVLNKYREKYD